MADYWKSQPRKFCDFCKCWIADNKPSVEFHERGKRHKENVQKKIDELRKRSGVKAKEDEELAAGLAHVEKAALEALKKDLAKDPSLAAQYGVTFKSAAKKDGGEKTVESTKAEVSAAEPEAPPAPAVKIREWFEAKAPEGYSYYWNTTTNESVWEPPEEYVSLAEQEGYVEQGDSNNAPQDVEEPKEEEAEEEEEEEAMVEPPEKIFRVDPVGTRGAAYGAWQTIRQARAPKPQPEPKPEPEPEPAPPGELPALDDIPLPGDIPLPSEIALPGEIPLPSDIPLPVSAPAAQPAAKRAVKIEPEPEQELEQEPEPEPAPPPPVKKDRFKEKTITSLGFSSGANVGFKKRKIASSARNARQRDNDN